jgi:hypothetical protein
MMKTLSIMQPWASLLAEGVKGIELRGWSSSFRGLLLIRASKNAVPWVGDDGKRIKLPTECLLWVGELVCVRPMEVQDRLPAMSIFSNDEYSWLIKFHYYVLPTPATGKLKLYETPDSLIQRLPEADTRKYHPELFHRTRHPFTASVVGGELMVIDTRTGLQTYYTVHLDHKPPLAWVFVPMYSYIGGVQGGGTKIKLQELADSINQGNCFLCVDDLPHRQDKTGSSI